MIEQVKTPRFLILTVLVVLAAATRALPLLLPHMWNFTAVGALAIFAGAQFKNKTLALAMPLAAMALADLFLGNGFSLSVYTGFVAMVVCGMLVKKVNIANVGLASIAGAFIFYLVTNFAFLYPVSLYPHNMEGIIASYVAALPFFGNMLIADVIYGFALFGSFYYIDKSYPAMVREN